VTSSTGRLVFAGEAIVDLVLWLDHLPPLGGDVLAAGAETTVGGGYNVMVAAARQGMEVVYAGGHGTGPWGDLVRRTLTGAGITLAAEVDGRGDSGFCVVLVDGEGERTFVTRLGAESARDAATLAGTDVGPGDWVYVSGYGLAAPGQGGPLATWVAGLEPAVTVLVDPGPLVAEIPPNLLDPVLARADWWSANQREAAVLTGREDPVAACRVLLERTGRSGVVVRIGSAGCLLGRPQGRDRPITTLPAPAVEVVDTTGAGDTHCGVFLAGLATGVDPLAAAERANLAAAWSVTRRGPATAPTASELVEWGRRKFEPEGPGILGS
jgi:sugar/nucleoside kinase (ribokinase family)